jgi:hypothetical protein
MSAHVLSETQRGVFDLPRPGFSLKLFAHLIEHPEPGGSYGMSETFQASAGLNRQRAVQSEKTGFEVLFDPAPGTELQIFHDYCFVYGETVMDLSHAYLFPRVLYASLFICCLPGAIACLDVREIAVVSSGAVRRIGANL